MRDRMEPQVNTDKSTASAKAPKTAVGSQDCSCAEARAHLEAFLDRECTAGLTERLAQHVATCLHCPRRLLPSCAPGSWGACRPCAPPR